MAVRDVRDIRGDRILMAALVLFAVFFRFATLMAIHTGVDERDYWYSAKCIARGWPYPELTHRTVRFAVIIPTAAAQALLGDSPNVYYVSPVLNAALQAALAFALGRRLKGRLAGTLAALGLILFPYMIRAGSQVRPEIFSLTYILAALWCFLVYFDRAEKGDKGYFPFLLGSATLLFVAYEANVTNLFFVPGLAIMMLLRKRPWKDILSFCALLLALYAAETTLYALFTPFKFGQLQVIEHSHLEGNDALVPLAGLMRLFDRYRHPYLQTYWQASFVVFAAAAAFSLAKKEQIAEHIIVATALGYFICMTFAVKSLSPLVPAEPFINRYFCAALGPISLVVASCFTAVVEHSCDRCPALQKLRDRFNAPSAGAYIASIMLAVVLVTATFSSGALPRKATSYTHSIFALSDHPLTKNIRYRSDVDRAWDSGLPIVAIAGTGGENALQSAWIYYLSSDRLRRGAPPELRRIQYGDGGYLEISQENVPTLSGTVLVATRQPIELNFMDASSLPNLR